MSKIIISRGDHRNEKVAYELADSVFKKLKSQDLDVELLTMSGLHSLVDNLLNADEETVKEFSEKIYVGGFAKLTFNREKLKEGVIFDFHNTPTDILNPDNLKPDNLPLRNIETIGGNNRYKEYHGEDISWCQGYEGKGSMIAFKRRCHYLGSKGLTFCLDSFTIEVPAVYLPYSLGEQRHFQKCLERARKLRPHLKGSFDQLTKMYLTSYADLCVNEQLGYLDDRLVSRLAALVNRLVIIYDSPISKD